MGKGEAHLPNTQETHTEAAELGQSRRDGFLISEDNEGILQVPERPKWGWGVGDRNHLPTHLTVFMRIT